MGQGDPGGQHQAGVRGIVTAPIFHNFPFRETVGAQAKREGTLHKTLRRTGHDEPALWGQHAAA
jgi:hypothetical protein